MIDFFIPVKTVSEANQREHWAVKMKRKQSQQEEVSVAMHNALRGKRVQLPCTVKLTRIGPRTLDSDNLASAFKGIRDAVARKIGVDDGSDQIRFEYAQQAIRQHNYGVKIQIIS